MLWTAANAKVYNKASFIFNCFYKKAMKYMHCKGDEIAWFFLGILYVEFSRQYHCSESFLSVGSKLTLPTPSIRSVN